MRRCVLRRSTADGKDRHEAFRPAGPAPVAGSGAADAGGAGGAAGGAAGGGGPRRGRAPPSCVTPWEGRRMMREDIDSPETQAQFRRDFEAHLAPAAPVEGLITPLHAWFVMSALQLALRHPTFPEAIRPVVGDFARQLQAIVSLAHTLAAVAEAGWHRDADVDAGGRERCERERDEYRHQVRQASRVLSVMLRE